MKTLMTAVFVAALTCTGAAFSQDRTPPTTDPVKTADKKIAIEDVKIMLEAMGYEPQPVTNKDGKLIGYSIRFESERFTLSCRFMLGQDGTTLWLDGAYGQGIEESVPASALLKLLELNDSIWPAYITYVPNWKMFQVNVTAPTKDLTPATLRTALNRYTTAIKSVITTWQKAVADAKNKTKDPNPLP